MVQPQRRIPVAGQSRLRLRQPVPAEAPPAPAKRRWWRIPFAWFTEEAFWRDITKSAVSTGVVALIAYLYAVGAGYVSTPTGAQTITGVWNVVSFWAVGLLLFVMPLWAMFFNPKKGASRRARAIRWIIWYAVTLFVSLAMFHLLTGAFNDSWLWPFNTPMWHVPMSHER